MALAIAVGVPPQHGLYTAIIAGAIVALLGGCSSRSPARRRRSSSSWRRSPRSTASAGLLTAGLMAGVLLVAMGVARLGNLIQFIPHPVTTGFTTGIATVIATLQIKDVFGLQTGPLPEHFVGKLAAFWHARGTARAGRAGVRRRRRSRCCACCRASRARSRRR